MAKSKNTAAKKESVAQPTPSADNGGTIEMMLQTPVTPSFDLDALDLEKTEFVCDRDVRVIHPKTFEDAFFKAGVPRKLRRSLVPYALACGVKVVGQK